MLVVISDLHLVDGTGGGHNLPVEAFKEVFLCDIRSLAQDNNADEIKIVLLGDTIDLLRTAKWFQADPKDRPWGRNGLEDLNCDQRVSQPSDNNRPPSKTENLCMEILQAIINKNHAIFDFFKDIKYCFYPLQEHQVEIIYVPGNHDRLLNCYPSLGKKVAEELGLTIDGSALESDYKSYGDWCFLDYLRSEEYGVFAHHGHKFDNWNYAGSCDGVPIGDVITTEIVARIPCVFRREMDKRIQAMTFKDACEESRIKEKLDEEIAVLTEEIDNIRPLTSIVLYLARKSHKFGKLDEHRKDYLSAFRRTLWEVSWNFVKIRFTWKWLFKPRSLWMVICGIRQVLAELVDGWRKRIPDPSRDRYTKDAQSDYSAESQKCRTPFILYGHTHSPVQVPLSHDATDCDPDVIYINSGTWRPRIIQTADRKEYVTLKTMTYVVFYGPGEDPGKRHGSRSFDVWTGWQCKQPADGRASFSSRASGQATF
jgi:UDP-2,3-diacylglucosamine pyrophosphatase LpxH